MKAFGRDQNYEIYKTTTDDGFVLTLFRLLPKATPASKKGAVLVQHGLAMDATSWFSPQIYTDGNADTHALSKEMNLLGALLKAAQVVK